MTATTQILPFSTADSGSGGNRLTPSAYAALTTLLADGFQAGVGKSVQVNTVLAQASFMAAGLANFCVAQGVSVPDDGNLSNLVTEIETALSNYVSGISGGNVFTGGTTTGSANAQVIATTSPVSASFSNGQTVICTAGFTNTGSATFNAGGEGAIIIKKDSGSGLVVLTGNEVHLGDTIFLTKNTAGACWVLSAGLALGTLAYMNIGAGLANDGSGNLEVVGLSGQQIQQVYTSNNSYTALTTALPYTNSIPQNTDGDQIMSVTITPTNASNYLLIQATVYMGDVTGGRAAIALFQDSIANALAVGSGNLNPNGIGTISLQYRQVAGSASAQTFKIRAGDYTGSPTINGGNGSAQYGGASICTLTVSEIKA